MSDGTAIEAATRRLAAALDGLEAALDRRRDADRSEAALGGQVARLGADRSRLAAELDQQTARGHRMEASIREVVGRLDAAMDTVRRAVEAEGR